jgi:hypothetical protein
MGKQEGKALPGSNMESDADKGPMTVDSVGLFFML